MFPSRYFADRYFAPRYWAKVGSSVVSVRQVFTLPGGLRVTQHLIGEGVVVQRLDGTYTVVQRMARDVGVN